VIASEVQVSKYGADRCAGNGTAAIAALDPVNAGPANAANATTIAAMERARCIGHQLAKPLRDHLASGCRSNALRPAVARST
jgi:hypothetical protein